MHHFIPKNIRFFTNLYLPRTFKNMAYEFKGKAIIYGLRCQVDNMVYVGSTLTPGRRFHNHLVSHKFSNTQLQKAIQLHGLSKFTAYIFEVVDIPQNLTVKEKLKLLHGVEQTYIARFPKSQLYNMVNSATLIPLSLI
jgi:group I intron endonuclease